MDNFKITCREATIEDLWVLQHWDRQQHVKESDDDEDWDWEYELPRTLSWRSQLMFKIEDRPLGFVQIIDPYHEETHYWGTDISENLRALDIWIGEPSDIGKGYGTEMMEIVINRCFQSPEVKAILVDPLSKNTRAIRFYKRLGFEFVERRWFDDSLCDVYRLDRAKWEHIHDQPIAKAKL